MKVAALTDQQLERALPQVAALRIAVFREWPYLYDGDAAYEEAYLQSYRNSPRAVLIGAFAGDRLVGAATGTPLAEHSDDFAAAFADTGIAMDDVFYCAESVLLAPYRGRGIGHRFFDLREAHARAHGYSKCCFCAVQRPADHPLKLAHYRPLDTFWRARGYAPLPGVVASFSWKDIDQPAATDKPLQFWMRAL